jgi:glycosyltransferase involved in cell wall biosynthesis
LERTLDSLSHVSVPIDWKAELIVVDNGSEDDTPNVTRRFSHPNLPVRYVLEKRPGKGHAYNAGIAAAKGEILLFSDDDISFPSNWIERMCSPILGGATMDGRYAPLMHRRGN